jgi:hypothetical protein
MERLVEANEHAMADEEAYRAECKRLASDLKSRVAALDACEGYEKWDGC